MNKMLAFTLVAMSLWGCTGAIQAQPSCGNGVEAVKVDAGGYWVYKCPENGNAVKSKSGKTTATARAGIDTENDPNKGWYSAPVAGFRVFMHKETWHGLLCLVCYYIPPLLLLQHLLA